MFDQQKAFNALRQKQSLFLDYLETSKQNWQTSKKQLEQLDEVDFVSLKTILDASGLAWPGAYPTDELDIADRLCLPFEHRWSNHQEARLWAKDILMHRPVLAVDGSQITPSLDLATPVGAVQIGWFINQHNAEGNYIKDLDFEVFLPQDLIDQEENGSQELDFANRRVNQERFVRECEKISELMAQYQSFSDAEKPICFFDGSFIISFAGQLKPNLAAPYLGAITRVLDASRRYRVPLVGFVDNPHSRDFAKMLEVVLHQRSSHLNSGVALHDAELLGTRLPTMSWGVRTPLFVCAREDALSVTDQRKGEDRASFYKTVAFAYLRLTQNRSPARIELPLWLVEEGRAEEIINIVRAECIIGTGYPYAIETADALAVISYRDRQKFYALVEQTFPDLDLSPARKLASKQARR